MNSLSSSHTHRQTDMSAASYEAKREGHGPSSFGVPGAADAYDITSDVDAGQPVDIFVVGGFGIFV